MSAVQIRLASERDAERLLEIYSYYVEHTAISFECETPSVEEFRRRINKTLSKYPYFVIEGDGVIRGYTYASPFVGRAAYRYSSEATIYLDNAAKGRGYGRMLYEALESALKDMGITNVYACIGDPIEEDEYLTRNSEQFHARLGYKKVGVFYKCGYKFGRWYNMIWMEKIIGEHSGAPEEVKCFEARCPTAP